MNINKAGNGRDSLPTIRYMAAPHTKTTAPPKALNIMHWNTRSVIANGTELEHYIECLQTKPDIICIQKTWLKTGREFLLKEYECHRNDRGSQRGGGVATWIKSDVPARVLPVSTNPSIQCIVTEVILKDVRISICNIYHAEPESEKCFFSDILLQLPSAAFLCGDFNAHNPVWGGRKTDQKGKSLGDFIEEAELVVLNDGSGTCLGSKGAISPIDISMTTLRLASQSTWSVDHTTTAGSDHFPVHICIKGQRSAPPIQAKERWNIKKINWDNFTILSEEEIATGSENVSEQNNTLTKAILSWAESSSPRCKSIQNKQGVPWWNDKCQEATKAKRKAMNKVRRTRNPDYSIYKEERAACTIAIKTAKAEYWKEYCTQKTKSTTSIELWTKINMMSKRRSGAPSVLVRENGNVISNEEQKANMFADVYEKVSSDSNSQKSFWKKERSLKNRTKAR